MSPIAPPLGGNRCVWFALTSNFSANRPDFRSGKKKGELSLSELWQSRPGSQRRRQPAFRTISTDDRSYFQPEVSVSLGGEIPASKQTWAWPVPLRREWFKLVRDLPAEDWTSRKFLQSNSPTSRKSA